VVSKSHIFGQTRVCAHDVPLEEWAVCRRNQYLHKTTSDEYPYRQWRLNSQFQQSSGHMSTP